MRAWVNDFLNWSYLFQVEEERSREEEEEWQQRVGDFGDGTTEAAREHQAQEEEEVQVSVDQSTLPCARGLRVRMLLNSAVTILDQLISYRCIVSFVVNSWNYLRLSNMRTIMRLFAHAPKQLWLNLDQLIYPLLWCVLVNTHRQIDVLTHCDANIFGNSCCDWLVEPGT